VSLTLNIQCTTPAIKEKNFSIGNSEWHWHTGKGNEGFLALKTKVGLNVQLLYINKQCRKKIYGQWYNIKWTVSRDGG
jgi:hypothetical protein